MRFFVVPQEKADSIFLVSQADRGLVDEKDRTVRGCKERNPVPMLLRNQEYVNGHYPKQSSLMSMWQKLLESVSLIRSASKIYLELVLNVVDHGYCFWKWVAFLPVHGMQQKKQVPKMNLLFLALFYVVKLAMRLYFKAIHVTGFENIPQTGPVIFAANHPK